jgi:hypothetical protein
VSGGPGTPEHAEQKAAYQVSLECIEAGITDAELLGIFAAKREEIQTALTAVASDLFGPAWVAVVGEGNIAASVAIEVYLLVRYPVRGDSAAPSQLQAFTAEIRRAVFAALPGVAHLRVRVRLDSGSVLDAAKSGEKAPWDRMAPVLAAVATGIGVLGFVTFVGGAILWARFGAAGLPQELALSAAPTHDMVVVGARTLVPAIGWGLAACAIYLVLELWDNRPRKQGTGHEEGLDDAGQFKKIGKRTSQTANVLAKNGSRALLVGAIVLLFVAVELWNAHLAWGVLGLGEWIVLVLLAALAIVLTALVAYRYSQFLYLVATIFLGLAVYSGVVAYIHATDHASLRPVAVVRDNKEVIAGFMVAEGSDRVYLARVDLTNAGKGTINHPRSRLVGIDKDQVSDVEVGPSMRPALAAKRAERLVRELCSLEPLRARAKTKKTAAASAGAAKQCDALTKGSGCECSVIDAEAKTPGPTASAGAQGAARSRD